MTDLRKAAEMALEILETDQEKLHWQTVRALRQALSQPEQEPVAWVFNRELFWSSEYEIISEDGDNAIPLYTAPPKREWVGITKEDKKEILEMTQPDERGYVIAITEAKLKEKNT